MCINDAATASPGVYPMKIDPVYASVVPDLPASSGAWRTGPPPRRPTEPRGARARGRGARAPRAGGQRRDPYFPPPPPKRVSPPDAPTLVVQQGRRRDQARLQRRAVRIHLE